MKNILKARICRHHYHYSSWWKFLSISPVGPIQILEGCYEEASFSQAKQPRLSQPICWNVLLLHIRGLPRAVRVHWGVHVSQASVCFAFLNCIFSHWIRDTRYREKNACLFFKFFCLWALCLLCLFFFFSAQITTVLAMGRK